MPVDEVTAGTKTTASSRPRLRFSHYDQEVNVTTELLLARDGAVATLTINRPEKRNALSAQLMGDIVDAISALDADADIRAIILTGSDPAFCAGFDLRNLKNELAGTRSLARPDGSRSRGLLPNHDTPILGAINGPAITGGLELAMACDFMIASERARFADTHGRVGVMPGGGMSIRLPELVGIDRARRMSLTGDLIDAATALQWGLVTEVTPHDALMDRAREIAASMASLDPAPVAELRRMYEEIGAMSGDDAWQRERRWNRSWMTERFSDQGFEPDAIIARGSQQTSS